MGGQRRSASRCGACNFQHIRTALRRARQDASEQKPSRGQQQRKRRHQQPHQQRRHPPQHKTKNMANVTRDLLCWFVKLFTKKSCDSTIDVSRALVHPSAKRNAVIELPENDQHKCLTGRLLRTLYGTRDATAEIRDVHVEQIVLSTLQTYPSTSRPNVWKLITNSVDELSRLHRNSQGPITPNSLLSAHSQDKVEIVHQPLNVGTTGQ